MIVCDLWAKEFEHLEFNKSILELIDDNIIYLGEEKQIYLLKRNNFLNIEYINLRIEKRNKLKMLIILFQNLKKINRIYDERLVILNSSPLIILLTKLLIKHKKVYFFLHGLDGVVSENQKKGMYKFLYKILKFKQNFQCNYIVLGENIKKNLNRIYPEIKNIYSVDHPYSFNENFKIKSLEEKLKVATCGITSQSKGLENIYKFIDKKGEKIEFKHIGTSKTKILSSYLEYFSNGDKLLSIEDYRKLILELDFLLILYPNDSYKLTASGVFFDCIKYNKPLLGLKNEYFDYMFKKYKPIGKLFNSVNEIVEYLEKEKIILEKDQKLYLNNIKFLRKKLNEISKRELLKVLYN